MLKKITFIFLLCIAVTPMASANWVDDWFDMMNTTNPSSYQSQERGFATAGGFQARMRVKTDNLLTISPPRFNVGCGGIDIFMGGFSFLNADYIVEKFERIIRMAPALAFQVALNELSSTISEKVEGMEQVMNTLNSLQLDECQAAKGIVNFAADMYRSGPTDAIGSVADKVKDGYSNLFNDAKKDAEDKPGKAFKDGANKQPAGLKAELLKSGSYLKNIGDRFNLSTSEIDQLRAIIGDVEITLTDNIFNMQYKPGCIEATYEALVEKTPLTKTLAGACTETNGKNIKEKTDIFLNSIALKITTNRSTPPTPEEMEFINFVPYPVKHMLNVANKYGTAQINTIKDSLSTPSAYAFAYGVFTNMLYNLQDLLKDYQAIINSGDSSITSTHLLAIKELIKEAEIKQEEAYKAYAEKTSEIERVYTILNSYAETDKVIQEVLKKYSFVRGK
jgi:conjugative transfer pilus assembly protein TraH